MAKTKRAPGMAQKVTVKRATGQGSNPANPAQRGSTAAQPKGGDRGNNPMNPAMTKSC